MNNPKFKIGDRVLNKSGIKFGTIDNVKEYCKLGTKEVSLVLYDVEYDNGYVERDIRESELVAETPITKKQELNLCELLKGHKGVELWSPAYGTCTLIETLGDALALRRKSTKPEGTIWFKQDGTLYNTQDGECILFPSKDQRDWNEWAKRWKPKRWRANLNGGKYYHIAHADFQYDTRVVWCEEDINYGNADKRRYDFGNYFRTKEQAQEAMRRVKETLDNYHKEIGE